MSFVSEGAKLTGPLAGAPDFAPAEPSLATGSDYFALLKPRVMSLVVFTALVGLAVAPGALHPVTAFTAPLCIAVGPGAAGGPRQAGRGARLWADARRLLSDDARRAGECLRRGAAGLHHLLLCRDLHDWAEAHDTTEHRDRRCGRGLPADGRLAGRDRLAVAAAGL